MRDALADRHLHETTAAPRRRREVRSLTPRRRAISAADTPACFHARARSSSQLDDRGRPSRAPRRRAASRPIRVRSRRRLRSNSAAAPRTDNTSLPAADVVSTAGSRKLTKRTFRSSSRSTHASNSTRERAKRSMDQTITTSKRRMDASAISCRCAGRSLKAERRSR